MEITTTQQFMPAPRTMSEAMEYAKMISNSAICPKNMRGKPGDVLVAIQLGFEVGLSPLQALQSIAIINDKPVIWGDAALALVQSCKAYEYHKEGSTHDDTGVLVACYCTVKRKGCDEYTYTFTVEMAKKANLWTKPGVWQQYPARMLQMRARAFALRDQFSDAMKGLAVREEVEDYHIIAPKKTDIHGEIALPVIQNDDISLQIDEWLQMINHASDLEELKTTYTNAYQIFKGQQRELDSLTFAKDIKKSELQEVTTHE